MNSPHMCLLVDFYIQLLMTYTYRLYIPVHEKSLRNSKLEMYHSPIYEDSVDKKT